MFKKLIFTLAILVMPVLGYAQYDETSWPVIDVGSPAPSHTIIGAPGDTIVWKAGNVYHIEGFIFVDTGATLVIQPGTIIKGDPGQGANATALIIPRGAKIIAKGSPKLPIIFTTTLDMVGDTADIPDVASSRGLWGGLILEGKAFTCAAGGESEIEGVPVFAGHEYLSKYGGGMNSDCSDNSGILQYISIRYPGSILAPNVEINGLSLAAIGSGTTVDHIDVYFSADDDIENWGGSVNLSYTTIFYGDDDGWDTDECWNGLNQFGLMVKDPRWGDRETENDGRQQAMWTDTTSIAQPASPSGWGCNYPGASLHANLTCIGQGPAFNDDEGNRILMRENYRAYWYNNVFMEQPKTALEIDCPGGDVNIDVAPSSTRNLPSGAASIAAGFPLLDLVGNFWWQSYNLPSGSGSQYSHFISTGGVSGAPLATARVRNDVFPGGDTTITGKNHIMNPMLTDYEVVNPPVRREKIDPRPAPGSPLLGSAATVDDHAVLNHDAYVPTTYVGAFEPNKPMWAQQPWVTAYNYRILPRLEVSECGLREGKPVKELGSPAPSHTIISEDMVLSADTIYHLQGFVFVDSGHTLFIESGSTIKGDPGQGANATALIIPRGAKIFAMGTKEEPIIMTTWLDDVDDPNDIPDVASSRGLWGGLILQGKAFVCAAGGESEIEGVPVFAGHEYLSKYGGGMNSDCSDNSGILQYISIRYPGSILAPNVEINGLSLAAIGSGTTVDHIEVYYSADDDIENWGGSVNLSYTCIFYGDDDGWDTDECWNGLNQFGLMVKDPRWGDRETENDGRQQAVWTDTTSIAQPASPSGWGCDYPAASLHANLTCIGQGPAFNDDEGNRILIRENYRGYWYNNVFMEQPKTALEIDCPGGDVNIDVAPSTTRNLPSGAASIAAGFPLLDLAGNFWWQSYNLPSGSGSQYSHFISTGGVSGAPLATARVRNDLFPGGDTTITGKNHIMNPMLTSYEVVNPPVRHGIINPVPAPCSPLIGNAKTVDDYAVLNHGAYVPTTYVGAFEPGVDIRDSWIWGWTVVSDCYGILGDGDPISCGGCCKTMGNVDNSIDGLVTMGDLTVLIDNLFISLAPLTCNDEGNVDLSPDGLVTMGDLTVLIDNLFISLAPLPTCNQLP